MSVFHTLVADSQKPRSLASEQLELTAVVSVWFFVDHMAGDEELRLSCSGYWPSSTHRLYDVGYS